MNILLLASHGIAEFDDVRMFASLGFDVFAPGGYEDPAKPGEALRPALPEAPDHPELRGLCREQRERHGDRGTEYAIDWAKADLHGGLIDWADVIIGHHFVDRWLGGQWDRIRDKRVIWRTCGQSNPQLEWTMSHYDGLQIVRYSPAERRHFEAVGAFAGEDAVIRFGKFAEDYGPWIGDGEWVGNITQNMIGRGESCGLSFYLAATEGLPARPAGPDSEKLPGGIGALGYDEMREYLRHCRAYLYTGTTPASYTLGLIEAALSGVPVVSIGPNAWQAPPDLFEGHEIANVGYDDPAIARQCLQRFLTEPEFADAGNRYVRRQAIAMFGMDAIGPRWVDFLGAGVVREMAGVAA